MESTTRRKKCAHPACSCVAPPNQSYCCEYCEITTVESSCGCGHNECMTATGRLGANAT